MEGVNRRPLLGREIVGTGLVWVEWVSSDPTPCRLRFDLAAGDEYSSSFPKSVWTSAGRRERDRFAFATDDVMVIFDPAEAVHTRIMTNSYLRAPSLGIREMAVRQWHPTVIIAR